MGPGTDVQAKIEAGIKPTSSNDAVALQHDIDYLADGEMFGADLKAIVDSDMSMQGTVMKIGLAARSVADAYFHISPFSHFFDNPFHFNGKTGMTPEEVATLQTRLRSTPMNPW